jgi:hypothetical protein
MMPDGGYSRPSAKAGGRFVFLAFRSLKKWLILRPLFQALGKRWIGALQRNNQCGYGTNLSK